MIAKRSRPFAGTFLSLELETGLSIAELGRVFDLAEAWEAKLSPHRETSVLGSLRSGAVSAELEAAWHFCRDLRELSRGAFDPFLPGSEVADPGGWAKGFILDELANSLRRIDPTARGILNAGGDVRYLSSGANEVHLRLGPLATPFVRAFETNALATATSATNVAEQNARSSTRYHRPRRPGLTADHAVVVTAESALVADAMTKVGLFAEPPVIAECGRKFQARVLVFDPAGNLEQVFSS